MFQIRFRECVQHPGVEERGPGPGRCGLMWPRSELERDPGGTPGTPAALLLLNDVSGLSDGP